MPPFPRADGNPTSAVPGIDWRRTVAASLSLLCLAGAIVLASYPFIADRLGAWRASASFTQLRDELEGADAPAAQEAEGEAAAYNEMLAGLRDPSSTLPYDEQLSEASDGSICWIEIPSIGVKQPVYHGAEGDAMDAVLATGAAHMPGTSLPVGGESANTVITGHTGMRETRMFDQLDLLDEGDTVILWTLGAPYAYEVTGAELVEPDRVDVLEISPGVDQCTLITCRNTPGTAGFLPTGSYSHRLVVHSRRIPWDPSLERGSAEYLADARTALFCAAMAAAGALIWIVPALAMRVRRKWVLDRVTGNDPMTPRDVRSESEGRGTAFLRLGAFHRVRLDIFGASMRGRWSRVKGDRGRIRLELRERKHGAARVAAAGPGAPATVPPGAYEARALDGELGLAAGANVLVFREER